MGYCIVIFARNENRNSDIMRSNSVVNHSMDTKFDMRGYTGSHRNERCMKDTMQAVHSGLAYRQSSDKYHVLKSTVRDRFSN